MSRRATLEDIAQRAGVSRFTVARVLKGETKGTWAVTAERVEQIHTIARELGYRTNAAARATATGRFGSAAILTPAEGGDFLPMNVVRALIKHLGDHDLHLSIERLPAERLDDPEQLPKLLRELSVDGFFLSHAVDLPRGLRALLERGGVPAVWLNSKRRHDCVHPDDRGAAEALVARMVALGHRRLAWLPPTFAPPRFDYRGGEKHLLGWGERSGDEAHYSESDRRAGFAAACVAQEVEGLVWDACHPDANRAIGDLAALLERDAPSAVLAYRDREALLLRQAAERIGWRVPQRLSIATFGWESIAVSGYGLSAMDLNVWDYAQRAVELLRVKIAEPERRQRPVAVSYAWTDAGSVAPPAS